MQLANPDLGEYTPGISWAMMCAKSVWCFDPYTDDVGKFAKCLETANTCKYFEKDGTRSRTKII
jgi:hypothetical protein